MDNVDKKEPLFFVEYTEYYNRSNKPQNEYFVKKFPMRWVRLLNITQNELSDVLRGISEWSWVRNDDGTLVVGQGLTILPSKTMDMKMDVNGDNVTIKNNLLTLKNPDTDEDKVMTIRDYLYGSDNYIMNCWDYTKTKHGQEFRKKMNEEVE